MQVVDIDFPFGAHAPDFHCPSCGEVILSTEDLLEQPVCPHVKFVYFYASGEFEYADAEIKKALDGFDDDEDGDEDSFTHLAKKIKSKTAVVFSITTSGMACGPTSDTVVVGLDFYAEPGTDG